MAKTDQPSPATPRTDSDEVVDRRSRILDGARSAFLRFGFDRASIADIAAGAGVSRTAVYHYFPGKEDVLRAVVDELHAKTLRTAAKVLEDSDNLKGALLGLLIAKFGPALAIMAESPNGVELVDATNRLTGPATRTADDAFQKLVVTALVRHGHIKEPAEVAETLIAAAKGLMRSSDGNVSKATFEARVVRLIDWVTN